MVTIFAATLLAACGNSPEGTTSATASKQEAAIASGKIYNIDSTSTVGWEGSGVGHGHAGTFKVSKGTLSVDNGNITSGNFDISITSLDDSDIKDGTKKDLIGHLLSPDFFDATKYPGAKFEITKCSALTGDSTATHTISGNLTLKDSTKNVTFPAKVAITDAGVKATAKFNINRTDWGMSYGNDKSLKDKFISPEVGITLNINSAAAAK